MIIASHNTFSYRSPKKWYMRPIKFMAKCQAYDYKTQHEKFGVDCFDLRLFWDEDGNLEFRHGPFSYDASDFDEILRYCEDNDILLRVLFEERLFPKSLAVISQKMNMRQLFKDTCAYIEENYPKIRCFRGVNCGNFSETLHTFKDSSKYIEDGWYSSVTSLFKSENKILRVIDDFWPWLYARLKNRKNRKMFEEKYADKENAVVLFDFVHIK